MRFTSTYDLYSYFHNFMCAYRGYMDDIIFPPPLSGLFSFIAGDGFAIERLCKRLGSVSKHSLSVIWSSQV